MSVSNELVKHLRQLTGSSISLCKKVLDETGGDLEKSMALLKKESQVFAVKKMGRTTAAGVVESYIHSSRRIGVLLELRCETDFVARNHEFQELAHNIALHIAGTDPAYVNPDDVSLLAQPFVKDSNITVEELIKRAIAKFGEKIKIERFVRYEI